MGSGGRVEGEKEEGRRRRVEGGTGREEKIRSEKQETGKKSWLHQVRHPGSLTLFPIRNQKFHNTFTLRRLTEMDPFSQVMLYRQQYLPG